MERQSEIWFDYFRARDDSPITDLFEGQLCSTIQCKSCGHQSFTFDNFMDLSVSIPRKAVRYTGYVDVSELLRTYISPEVMERCGYKCQKCKKIDNLEKQMTVHRFPPILVVHLKRFYNSTMRREKLSTTVNIPKILDARPFATPNSNHGSKGKAGNYKLYGISHHSGSLNGGHYIGEVQNTDSGEWFNCNDASVSRMSGGHDESSASAYVLFYARD